MVSAFAVRSALTISVLRIKDIPVNYREAHVRVHIMHDKEILTYMYVNLEYVKLLQQLPWIYD